MQQDPILNALQKLAKQYGVKPNSSQPSNSIMNKLNNFNNQFMRSINQDAKSGKIIK
jgi:hypothetical protein